MEGDELTDLSLTRAKLRKKDDHHRFKASLTSPITLLSITSDLRVTLFGLYWYNTFAIQDSQPLGDLGPAVCSDKCCSYWAEATAVCAGILLP